MVGSCFCSPIGEPGGPDLGQSRANRALSGDKCRTPRRATLLRIVGRENCPLVCQPIDAGVLYPIMPRL